MTSMRSTRADCKKLEELLSIISLQLFLGQETEFSLVRETPLSISTCLMLQQVVVSTFASMGLYAHYRDLLLQIFPWREYSPISWPCSLGTGMSSYWPMVRSLGLRNGIKARGFIGELWSNNCVSLLTDYDAASGAGGSDFIVTVRRRSANYWEQMHRGGCESSRSWR